MEETIRCPYCDCKVRVTDVEAEDGACPECGAPVTGSLLFADDDTAASDDYDNDLDLEEDDDI